ncbi:MAG: ATP-binding protein [Fimbriimonadales bacterium]|nr:ATP-binding protein [Fimbriimonadales bacterium]
MLRESQLESKRRALVETPLFNLTFMPSLLLLPDSLHIYRATDAATRVLGYSHEQLSQMTLYDLLVEDKPTVDADLTRARANPPFVLTLRRPDHEERILEGIVHELPDYELLHFSFADLTGLHLAYRIAGKIATVPPSATGAEFLREAVRLISGTLGSAHVYVGELVDAMRVKGVVYAVGGEMREPLDYALPGTPCENAVARGVCFYPRSVQLLFPQDKELQDLGLESYIGAPLRDSFGRVIGILWMGDVKPTPDVRPLLDFFRVMSVRASHELLRDRAEMEAQRLREQLLQAQKMESIGRMAGGLAHDFNNMLTAVLGYAELAQGALPQDHPAYGFLNSAILAVEKASQVTRQLMTLARQQPMERRPVNLNEIVQESLRIAQTWLPASVQVQTFLSDTLWQTEADPTQLGQVLQNLLLNARDAIPDTGGVITIETENVHLDVDYARTHYEVVPGDYVMLMVSDTGVGMPPHVRERIFEPFFTTKPHGQGTGLGLSIVYSILKQLGGHIWVYSEVGKGTTFKIYLPRAYERMRLTPTIELAPTELPRGQETILVVEDEPGVLEVASETLRQQGYTVITAQSPPEALQIAQSIEEPIHLLITDVVMPVMSGRELADYMLRLRGSLKVLYVSGYTENTIVHHGVLDAGVNFLPKPYTPSQLLQKVREVLDSPS